MIEHKSQILTDHESRILAWGLTLGICLILIGAAVSHYSLIGAALL